MNEDLYRTYKGELSPDKSDIDYCVAFIKTFRTLKQEFVKDTIWEELWGIAPTMDDLELAKQIVKLSKSLNSENSMYCKYTSGFAYKWGVVADCERP